jgi:hypothetical protein
VVEYKHDGSHSLRHVNNAILAFEKISQSAILENRSNYLPNEVIRSDMCVKTYSM